MRILTLTVILGLPLLALGQTTEPQQSQEQTKETQTTAPAKTKKMRPEQAEPNKPEIKSETGTSVRGQTNVKGRTQEMNRNEPGGHVIWHELEHEHERDEHEEHESHDREQARVQVASQRSVQSWAASEGVLRPTIRSEPFPVDREHILRVRGQLLGRG